MWGKLRRKNPPKNREEGKLANPTENKTRPYGRLCRWEQEQERRTGERTEPRLEPKAQSRGVSRRTNRGENHAGCRTSRSCTLLMKQRKFILHDLPSFFFNTMKIKGYCSYCLVKFTRTLTHTRIHVRSLQHSLYERVEENDCSLFFGYIYVLIWLIFMYRNSLICCCFLSQ